MKNRISHFIKTTSFDSDGRLLKWLDSLSEKNASTEVFILEDNNRQRVFKYNDINISSTSLRVRKFFKKGKGYIVKVPELAVRSLSYIFKEKPRVIIFHDLQHYLTILAALLLVKPFIKIKIVWDLHELPHAGLMNNLMAKNILRFMLSNCDLLIYTNKERRAYILDNINHREKNVFVLNNFPSVEYVNKEKSLLPDCLLPRFAGAPYILWLGAAAEGRNFSTFLNTYEKYKKKYKLVILGRVDERFKNQIDALKKGGYVFTDFVPQNELIRYIDNAYFSVVLYNHNSPNNRLCEPNRLYQLMTRNIPIICGNNPTMKHIIEKYGGGIVLPDDGSSLNTMRAAFIEMENNYNAYKKSEVNYPSEKTMIWEAQFDEMYKKLLEL